MRLISTLPLLFFIAALPAAAPPSRIVPDLLRQLGDERLGVREQAHQRLLLLEPSEAALRPALDSGDAEVARRVRRILATLGERRLSRLRNLLQAHARAAEVDLFAERFLTWRGADDQPDCWQTFLSLIWNVFDYEARAIGRFQSPEGRNFPRRSFDHYKVSNRARLEFLAPGTPNLVVPKKGDSRVIAARADGLTVRGTVRNSLLISGGKIELVATDDTDYTQGFVLAADGVSSCTLIHAVVICGGDCEISGGVTDALIVARGNVKLGPGLEKSVVLAGGDVVLPPKAGIYESEIHAAGRVVNPVPLEVKRSNVHPGSPRATEFVRFFETRRVGLEVAPADAGVRVTSAKRGMPFHAAGVRAGDALEALDGKAVASPEAVRRHLRRRAAVEGFADLQLRRDGERLRMRVRFD